MGQLVFVDNGRLVTDSLTVARVFEKSHDHVMRDIRQQLAKLDEANEFQWGVTNFGETFYRHPQNGQLYSKFNMTEDAFAIVAMSYVTPEAMKMKVKFLNEFKRMKEALSQPRELSRLELIDLARESEMARLDAEKKNAELEYQLRVQHPKVVFADAVTVSQNTILIRELAVILKQNDIEIGEKRLFEWLRDNGYLIKRAGTDRNTPTQKAKELGLFEIKETPIVHSNGTVTVSKTTKVTGKDQVYFVNKFKTQQSLEPVEV
ncbi:phage antirepressor KilAC domain-containing protein [Alicyclobacillus ferrooxydans]|uniref:Antirepressor protein C-terminal domain-containing protein n=1 Tax=Alicyclobacillus ferrooxydans TaxID=471514 RepID=A0A0P9C9W3_9BACL|nr:phage antirepressor KilAC domain-containing protein [Alicyclobacillus ferrooxydans]KPV42003.1 hypothetical protein AN477_19735 [Alicyclobacillus ferrooxydans]